MIFLNLITGQNILKWIGIITVIFLLSKLFYFLDKKYHWNLIDLTWKDILSRKKKP